jgi:uncharacterized protein with HEPN domain
MSPDEESDPATLGDLVAACSRVMGYVRGASRSDLDVDDRLFSACCYQISVIGEAVKRVSPITRDRHPEVPWKDIAGMRDRLIHGYDSVDLGELWKTATEDVLRCWSRLGQFWRSISDSESFAARACTHRARVKLSLCVRPSSLSSA